MLSDARPLTVFVTAVKTALWLCAAVALITLLFWIVLWLAQCVDPESCHLNVGDGVVQSLFWPVIWAIHKTGFLPLMVVIVLLILLFVTSIGIERIVATQGVVIRISAMAWLYAAGALITFPFQAAPRAVDCANALVCGKAAAVLWSLFWPIIWSMTLTNSVSYRGVVATYLILVLLFVLSAALDRLAASDAYRNAIAGNNQSRITLHSQSAVAAFGIIALLAVQLMLLSMCPGLTYGGGDGMAAQALIFTTFKFGGWLDITNINPLQGLGSQMLPLNVWVNPAYWPFAFLTNQFTPEISGMVALVCFALACYVMARCFDVPLLPSIVAAQLCILLFVPIGLILGLAAVFYINPGLAVVYAPNMIALGLLARMEPGPVRNFVFGTAGLFLLLLYSLYCDPLWSMVSGISWAVPLAVVALRPWNVRGVLVRCAALGCCVVLLALTGPLEYLYSLSQYTARVQFSDLLGRTQSSSLASILFRQQDGPTFYYATCILGWLLGCLLLRNRMRDLVLAAVAAFAAFFAYATAFLVMPGQWWLPLPFYVEHCLIPLFTTAAVVGLWSGIRVIVWILPLAQKNENQHVLAPRKGLTARSPFRWLDAIQLRRPAWMPGSFAVAFLAYAFILSLFFERARVLAEVYFEPRPNEPELRQLLDNKIGLGVNARFRGSVFFYTFSYDEIFTLASLWADAVPTTNEYSQLVTPQAIYFIHQLFKRRLSTDLNWFRPWINTGDASFAILFRTFRALGIRYVGGHEQAQVLDMEGFRSASFPRRQPGKPPGLWVIYEIPDVNVGDYSPTEVTTARSAAEIVAALGGANFDFTRQAVLSAEVRDPLVRAREMKLSVIRGGLHVSGHSNGTSLVVLPQQFSHCLRAHDSRARLVRANLIMTGMIFSGTIDTDISFDYGIFSPACRRDDFADMNQLGIKLGER
jgi:hypothetical protein